MKATQAKAVELPVPKQENCCICQKPTHGYGRWKDGITCSRTCEGIKAAREHILRSQ